MPNDAHDAGAALICGSAAYDHILTFNDRFKAHILPDRLDILNVSFLAPEMRREFGGCALNIAYNLKLLGTVVYPMAAVGHDFAPYRNSLVRRGVPTDFLTERESQFTAQCFITTDLDGNQITIFHPGAMQEAHLKRVEMFPQLRIGIVAPDGRQAMLDHAGQFAALGVPFIFDPGQGMPMFDGAELRQFIEQATWIAVNEYEWEMLAKKTAWGERDMLARVRALIVTHGKDGARIFTPEQVHEVPAARVSEVVDPTGCGDAFRAGLIHGLLRGWDWPLTGRAASLMGAIKIESRGPQNHEFTRAQFERRFSENFPDFSVGLSA